MSDSISVFQCALPQAQLKATTHVPLITKPTQRCTVAQWLMILIAFTSVHY